MDPDIKNIYTYALVYGDELFQGRKMWSRLHRTYGMEIWVMRVKRKLVRLKPGKYTLLRWKE